MRLRSPRGWGIRGPLLVAFASLIVVTGVTAPGSAPVSTQAPTSLSTGSGPRVIGFSTGSSVLWASDSDLNRTLDAVVASRATSIRIDIPWRFVESVRRRPDWSSIDRVVNAAVARNLSILGTITTTPVWAAYQSDPNQYTRPASASTYGAFAYAVAARYRGKISTYELWNEPNGRMFFAPDPDPVFYAQMLAIAYPRIKAADPGATVLAGALGPVATGDGLIAAPDFLEKMYASGARGSFDAISFHPYDFRSPLAVGVLYDNSPMRQMIRMHASMTANGDGAKKIWITEYGSPTSVVGDQSQADLLMASLPQWTEVPFAGPLFIYTVRDANSNSTDSEDTFGVVRTDFTPKPSLLTVEALIRQGIPERTEAQVFRVNADPSLGGALGPVFPISYGLGREFEQGSRFLTNNGFLNSPPEVARLAMRAQLVPATTFANGWQDFDIQGGFRIFSGVTTGTHAVFGAILAAWTADLGFPLTDEQVVGDGSGRAIDFEHGRIVWSPAGGTTVIRSQPVTAPASIGSSFGS